MKLVLEHNRDFSGGPGVETLHFQGRGLWVQALVRELGCQDPHGGAKKYIFFKRLEHVTERHTSLKTKEGKGKSNSGTWYVLSHIWFFAISSTVARQAPLSMEFPRQGYWSGLPFPPPGILPNPGIEPMSLVSLALQGGFFNHRDKGEALQTHVGSFKYSTYVWTEFHGKEW